ncbi:choice-of-anchor C family protein [Zavarzinella formosa]|uniref:choice-of-anchor C family protein n=1 Tax=Zavarzinella formosa TaxID=360055 RepID=UPI0002EFD555|nr:choice-of-anchor C family protein [Zavarzinella formosa]
MRHMRLAMACLLAVGVFSYADDEKSPKNLVVNGSFEDGPEVPAVPGFASLDKDSDAIKGWKVTRGQIDLIEGYWKGAEGKRSLDLNGSPGTGGVKQTITTEKGKKYKLTFKLAGNPGAPAKKEVTVEAGESKKAFAFDATGKTQEEMGWELKELEFTATGDKTDIELYSTTADTENSGPAIDDVKVVEVK